MPELNKDLLKENIRKLLDDKGVTQAELAEITGMSQPNVSKALNPKDKKCFTVDQLFAIAQHFGVSLDELTGNKVAEQASTSPRAVFAFITALYKHRLIRFKEITDQETVYEEQYNSHGYPEYRRVEKELKYLSFFFPNYMDPWEYSVSDDDYFTTDAEFSICGNDSKFINLNLFLKDFLPIIKLHRNGQVAEKPFQMILDDYLANLSDK